MWFLLTIDSGGIMTMAKNEEKVTIGQRWNAAQPTKTFLFWSCVVSIILTMIIGFALGGWVTGGTAQSRAEEMAEESVLNRLAPICVAQFNQDPEKDKKLEELKKVDSWKRGDYVKEQGWATMPGEKEPDRAVANKCVEQIMQIGQ
jgi:hypothetical protein